MIFIFSPESAPRRGEGDREERGEAAGTKDEDTRRRVAGREGESVAEVGCWWWLAERRRQWCRPVARWRHSPGILTL